MKLSKNTDVEIKDERIVIRQWNQTVLLDEHEWKALKEYVAWEQSMAAKSFEAG